jgi:hypothetical protein
LSCEIEGRREGMGWIKGRRGSLAFLVYIPCVFI